MRPTDLNLPLLSRTPSVTIPMHVGVPKRGSGRRRQAQRYSRSVCNPPKPERANRTIPRGRFSPKSGGARPKNRNFNAGLHDLTAAFRKQTALDRNPISRPIVAGSPSRHFIVMPIGTKAQWAPTITSSGGLAHPTPPRAARDIFWRQR
jgi:hypothetical protein